MQSLRNSLTLVTFLATLLVTACQASAGGWTRVNDIVEVDSSKHVVVIGTQIAGRTMREPVKYLIDALTAPEAPEVIQLVINSPGGSVAVGSTFLALMRSLQANGTQFRCYVPELAASMAFSILMQCNERYVLSGSSLLWHRARTYIGGMMGAALTGPAAMNIGSELLDIDDGIVRHLLATLGRDLTPSDIQFHFEQETFHTGRGLCKRAPNFCTSYEVIPGLFEALLNDKLPRSREQESIFDQVDESTEMYRIGEPVYISPIVLETLITTTNKK